MFCISAAQLADPDLLADDITGAEGALRGSGCKHDGGPLWVSIPIVDDPVVAMLERVPILNIYGLGSSKKQQQSRS